MKQFDKIRAPALCAAVATLMMGCGGDGNDPVPVVVPPTSTGVVESTPVIKNGVSCTTAMVPMRDGTKLYTEIYRPETIPAGTTFPVMVSRSPYGKLLSAGCFGPSNSLAAYVPKYVGVFQEVRGTASSEGKFTPFFQEQNDGYDLVEWAAKQTWSNGKVGMIGGSYGAVTLWQPALLAPPHLVAIAPSITTGNYRDDWVGRNGVYDLQFALSWGETSFMADQIERSLKAQGSTAAQIITAIADYNTRLSANGSWFTALPLSGTWDAQTNALLPYFWDWLKHPNYDDYWAQIDVMSQYSKIKVPAMISGGWYDLFAIGTIENFAGMRQQAGTQAARDGTMLLMDCCGHGFYRAPIAGEITWKDTNSSLDPTIPLFLDAMVAGLTNTLAQQPRVQISVLVPPDSGYAGSSFKLKTTDWPVPGTGYMNYSLRSGGRANSSSGDGVLDASLASGGPADSFSYDPLNPVPTVGGRDTQAALDQSTVEQRADVLVYTSAVVTQSMAMIGKVSLAFWAQTDGTDTDFTAKLVDVHPDGIAHNIVDRIVRARYRNGGQRPELLLPNTPYPFTLDLGYTSTMLKAGHKLRLEVSSSNFPQYQRNLNTGASNEDTSITRVARNTILHDATHPSILTIPVVAGVSAP